MDNAKEDSKIQNPESEAYILSRVFFIWTIPFFKKILRDPQLFYELPVLPTDDANWLGKNLEVFWEQELDLANHKKRTPILWNAIQKIIGNSKRWFDFILFINYVIMRPGLCILLAILIRTFREEYDVCQRCTYGAAFFIASLMIFTVDHTVNFQLNKIGLRIRAAVSSLMYRKILYLDLKSIEKITTENILRVISDDLHHLQVVTSVGFMPFICAVQFVVIIFAMWVVIGFPSLSGLLFIIIVIFPINSTYCRMQRTQIFKINTSTYIRIKFIKEIIEGIKTIKMNIWEKPFEKIIKLTRKQELENISKYFSYNLTFYSSYLHKFCTLISILSIFLDNKTLQPEQAFPCSQFLFVVLMSVLYWTPKSLTAHTDSYDTLNSVTQLLLMKEVKISSWVYPFEKPEIIIEKLCVHWSENDKFDLRIDDIRIKPGSLSVVIGPKNAGKTTLLRLMLNELLPRCGRVEVKGSVSYCSQTPWLYGSNIRNNIIFGRNYRESRYKNVVNACNLLPDFSQFMNGDASGVGPGGVVLGEDQKARINLARAVYHEADIYLIDDVLSTMDVEISDKLFDDCFTRYLARKTRVVVSNQIQFLDKADQIIVVDEGKAQIFNNLTEVKDSKIDIYTWTEDEKNQKKIKKPNLDHKMQKLEFKNTEEFSGYSYIETKYSTGLSEYIKSGQFILITFFLLLVTYAVITCCDFWLAYWCSKSYMKISHPTTISSLFSNPFFKEETSSSSEYKEEDMKNANTNLLIYVAVILSTILLIVLSNGFLINFFITAAKRFHENLSFSVLRAPMQFFYTNSMAKTFKVFTSDVETVDKKFPKTSKQTAEIFLFSTGCLLLVYITDCILLFSVILVLLYIIIQYVYLEVSKVLTNLETTARFPILSHVKETLQDVTTIRVHEGQKKSAIQFEKLLDNHTSLYRLNLACDFSFALWSTLLCNLLLFFTIFGLILINDCVHHVDPSYAGLAILQVYQLTEILHYGSKKLTESAQNAVSINRILEYSKIPGEQADIKKYHDSLEFPSKSRLSLLSLADYRLAPENWPDNGVVEFKNVSMTYPNKAIALDDVNFKINGNEKVGVVGRPGSGKSSLVAAIFNLHDFDGTISIDNFDTKLVYLEHLRKNISVIQQPALFSECVAYNLDPVGEFSEQELWDVLEEVNLKEHVEKLCELMNPSTSKFSKGQILLLCLARAILRKNKIIIFDEVATNVDNKSEELFHQLVNKHFHNCTILYITSYLNTAIMECDRVLVMEKGQIVDYDHPFSLLESEGAFYKLVCEAGKPVYSHYRHLAYQQYVTKFRCNGI